MPGRWRRATPLVRRVPEHDHLLCLSLVELETTCRPHFARVLSPPVSCSHSAVAFTALPKPKAWPSYPSLLEIAEPPLAGSTSATATGGSQPGGVIEWPLSWQSGQMRSGIDCLAKRLERVLRAVRYGLCRDRGRRPQSACAAPVQRGRCQAVPAHAAENWHQTGTCTTQKAKSQQAPT